MELLNELKSRYRVAYIYWLSCVITSDEARIMGALSVEKLY